MTSTQQPCTPTGLFLACGLFLLLVSSCGYSNPQTRLAELDLNDDGQLSIFVNMWSNKTNLLGLQGQIRQSLQQTLTKSNRFILSPSTTDADYILDGTIFAVEIPGLSYGAFDRAVELRAEVELGYQLRNAVTGKTVLEKSNYVKRQSFRVGNDSVRTQSNQDLALLEMADTVAEDIEIQLFYFLTREGDRGSKTMVPGDDIEELE